MQNSLTIFQDCERDILLVALRHLQSSLSIPGALSYLSDVFDVSKLSPERLEDICISLNLGVSHECYLVSVLSTCHLTENDDAQLSSLVSENPQHDYVLYRPSGYLLKIPERDYIDELVKFENLSENIKRLFQWANKNAVTMIHFDADAPVLDELPTFDW